MMRRIILSILALTSCVHAHSDREGTISISKNFGPTLQYTRFHQGCNNPVEKGFMVGPSFETVMQKPWSLYSRINFAGLWDIDYIAANNGVFVDANEYQFGAHMGYCFGFCNNTLDFSIFTGLDYVHLFYEVENDILNRKYNNINIPLGFFINHRPCKHFEWGLRAYYDIDAWTKTSIATPDICNNTHFKLRRGHKVHIEAPFTCHHHNFQCFELTCIFMPLFSWQKFNREKKCCSFTPQSPELSFWHLGATISLGIQF